MGDGCGGKAWNIKLVEGDIIQEHFRLYGFDSPARNLEDDAATMMLG